MEYCSNNNRTKTLAIPHSGTMASIFSPAEQAGLEEFLPGEIAQKTRNPVLILVGRSLGPEEADLAEAL